jgi:hypothetical protein
MIVAMIWHPLDSFFQALCQFRQFVQVLDGYHESVRSGVVRANGVEKALVWGIFVDSYTKEHKEVEWVF